MIGRMRRQTAKMTGKEFVQALEYFGMSNYGAADYFGVDRRTIDRYSTGDLKIPIILALLLAAMREIPDVENEPNFLRQLAGLPAVTVAADKPPGRPPSDG